MTILNFEGFEGLGVTTGTGAADDFQDRLIRRYSGNFQEGSNGVYPVAGYDGSGIAAFSDNQQDYIDIPFLADQYNKTIIVGIRFKTITTTSWQLVDFGSNFRAIQTRLRILLADQVELRRGSGTVLDTSASVLSEDTWHFVEIKLELVQATGSYEVKVDGNSVFSDAGPVDVLEGTETTCDFIRVWLTPHWYVDEIYILNTDGSVNNDYLGIYTRIEPYYPDEDGTTSDWTPSAGSDHYALVDETSESTANYVSSGTITDLDLFKFTDITATDTIHAVKLETYIGLSEVAGVRDARIQAVSGVTTSNGATFGVVDQTEQVESRILETDPNTSSLWLQAGLNAAEFGVEVMS
jgi:hypothetical protein